MQDQDLGRRELLSLGLAAGAALALAGVGLPAEARGTKDIGAQLRGGIERELRAAWAYRTAAGTGKLSGATLRLAETFAGHHGEHAEALAGVLRKLGGVPPRGRKTYDLSTFRPDLANERGILVLAGKLEADALRAYRDALVQVKDAGLRALCAAIHADEAMHLAVLRGSLGLDPVPAAFVTDPATWPTS